eukprot:1300660-Pyramimonas_sp.AAC.1
MIPCEIVVRGAGGSGPPSSEGASDALLAIADGTAPPSPSALGSGHTEREKVDLESNGADQEESQWKQEERAWD